MLTSHSHCSGLAVFTLIVACIASPSTLPQPTQAYAAILPSGFTDTPVAQLDEGTDMAFLPDQRILVTAQSGRLYVLKNGVLLAKPALDIASRVCDNWERGLFSVEADPNFAQNHYIYLYYTHRAQVPKTMCETSQAPNNRLSRFTLGDNNFIDPASEFVLIDNILSVMGSHNGGGLRFGGDGYLYLGVGDSGTGGRLSQDLTELSGKILRIAPDGSVPPTNPYANKPDALRCGDPASLPYGAGPCKEIFAYGLRNPWRLNFKPDSTQFFINDVGQGTWEEINDGVLNANYGWPLREGLCQKDTAAGCDAAPRSFTNPLHSYLHAGGCSAITGGAFVPQTWPTPYRGNYLFADLVCGRIYMLTPTNTGYTASLFASNMSAIVTMRFNPADSALYYFNYNLRQGEHGELRRINYVADSAAIVGNPHLPPVLTASASPIYGDAPLQVNFTAQTDDTTYDAVRYLWAFGDGSPSVIGNSTAIDHVYTVTGVYTAVVVALDSVDGVSLPRELRIDVGNHAPQIAVAGIDAAGYGVGQSIQLHAAATDAEEGRLPTSAITWRVLLRHIDQRHPENAHAHPYIAPVMGDTLLLTMPPPEDLEAMQSYLELQISATDASGLTSIVTHTLQPRRVLVALETTPAGLNLLLNDRSVATPRIVTSWAGYQLSVAAIETQFVDGQTAIFIGWGDGAKTRRLFTTPDDDVTVRATYALLSNHFDHRVWLPVLRDR